MVRLRVVLAMVALLAATVVMAQEKEKTKRQRMDPFPRAMMRIERFNSALEQLDLNAEQKQQLAKIHEKYGPKMKAVVGKAHEVFTEEQMKAHEEARKAAKAAGKTGRAVFEACQAAVKPTDEQKEKLAKIAPDLVALHKEAEKEVMAVLTPEQQNKFKEKLQPARKK